MTRHYRKVHNRPSLNGIRRRLRNNSTPEERLLWEHLKGRQLYGRKFRRQHSIHMWVVDFYCPSEKLVVELDGAHHFTKAGILQDTLRDEAFLEELGIHVIRFENREVREDVLGVLAKITKCFEM